MYERLQYINKKKASNGLGKRPSSNGSVKRSTTINILEDAREKEAVD